jgi:hypothetical protein
MPSPNSVRRAAQLSWIEWQVCALLTAFLVWLMGFYLAGSQAGTNVDEDVEE